VDLGYWDVFYYRHPYTGQMFGPLDVQPGQALTVRFTFYPRADAPQGVYSMRMLFQSNAAANPYPDIALSGTACAASP
jgi:hypothetical protein